MAANLNGKICVVTGATRGIGRGTAIALAEQGAIIYVSGRSTGDGPLTVKGTVAAIEQAGGQGVGVRVDHGIDSEIQAFFEQIKNEQGKIDILVNNVYTIPSPPAWGGGFWDHPIQVWDDQVGIGLRAHYVASWHAAPLMFAAGTGGLIVNVSSPGGLSYHYSSSYGGQLNSRIRESPPSPCIPAPYPRNLCLRMLLVWVILLKTPKHHYWLVGQLRYLRALMI